HKEEEDPDGGEPREAEQDSSPPRDHRRLHQTAATTAITPSGNSTSTARKMLFICCLVKRTSGGTGTPARTLGARSSRTSHRTMESVRSLLDMYGKKELLAKSPSPTITARKGRRVAPASRGASGQMPSDATARILRPGFDAAEAAGAPDSRTGWRSSTGWTRRTDRSLRLWNSGVTVTPDGVGGRATGRTPG